MTASKTDVVLVTCSAFPELPADDRPLIDALRARGLSVEVALWDRERDWSLGRLTVLRAAWNSHLEPQAFLRWLEMVSGSSTFLNGADRLRWTFDKRYLVDLGDRGVDVVPTFLLLSSDRIAIAEALSKLPQGDVVVKPRFGADAYGARRVEQHLTEATIAAHFQAFGTRGGLLVQPFLPAVEQDKERSLVFVAGEFSHALYRRPFGRGPTPQTPDNFHHPTDEELRYCQRLFETLGSALSYVRVDLIPHYGRPALMELEAIDPSLFFAAKPSAAVRLADEICARLRDAGAA